MFREIVARVCFITFLLTKNFINNVKRIRESLKRCIWIEARKNPKFMLVLCLCFLEVSLNMGRTLVGDSDRYMNLSLFFLGRRPSLHDRWYTHWVVMRPMVPLFAAPSILVLDDVYLSFGLVSGLFWIGGVIIAYKLGQILLEDNNLAILVALSYVFAPPLLVYGAGVMTESAGFFFIGLAVYLTLKRELQDRVSSKTYFLDALVVSFGVLSRESVMFGLLFMLVRRFMKRKGFLETMLAAILVGIFEYLYLHLLGFDLGIFFYKYNLVARRLTPYNWGVAAYLRTLKGAYFTEIGVPKPYFTSPIFWIWMLPALFYVSSIVVGFILNPRRKDLFLCMLFLVPISVIWPAMRARFSFGMWPAVLPAMISGAYLILFKLPIAKGRNARARAKFSNPKIFIFIFILCMGVINTVHTLISYGSLTIA